MGCGHPAGCPQAQPSPTVPELKYQSSTVQHGVGHTICPRIRMHPFLDSPYIVVYYGYEMSKNNMLLRTIQMLLTIAQMTQYKFNA
jgi:hypothetical protein